ncbi:MAG: hypothetical protein H6935_13255 [Thiobacillus sp.]|nr:hypothetical protein [Thiobacillus sp.]
MVPPRLKTGLRLLAGLGCLQALLAAPCQAADWSATDIQYLHGSGYEPADTDMHIVTLNHARGYDWGRVFAFVDYTKLGRQAGRDEGIYGELYGTFSLSSLTGHDFHSGLLKDVNLTLGVNYGDNTDGSNPRVILPGLTFDLDLPGFAFFNVDVLGYIDRGRFNGAATTCNAETYQVTPAWKLPFSLGRLRMSFEGFADIIGAHGTCVRQTLAQPQVRVDVGDMFGRPDRLYMGLEYQYWDNKFGVRGWNERVPQALILLSF